MPTDAYRAWVAAHPSLDALTDEQKDHEAALAMGWDFLEETGTDGTCFDAWCIDEDLHLYADQYHPTTDAAQAVELLSELAKSRGWRVHIMIDEDGTVTCFITDQLGTRRLANVIDTSEPRARTRACLAAMRGALEDDER